MLDRFLAYIKEHALFDTKSRLLVAVSGGKDSVALVDLLLKSDFTFSIAHCNFSLRGSESDKDAEFVKKMALDIDSTYYSKSFSTNKYAEENGISTQMAARELRYKWFDELLAEKGYTDILTAHHLNDSLETALFNFTKGTGVAGLKGILPINGVVKRPLLFAKRDEIDQYVSENNLRWREDSSNVSVKYHRNRLRHDVIPVLKEINSSLEDTFSNTSKRMISMELLLKSATASFEKSFIRNGSHLSVSKSKILETEIAVLENSLKKYGFHLPIVEELLKLVRNHSVGKVLQSATHILNVDREVIYLSPLNVDTNASTLISLGDKLAQLNDIKMTLEMTDDLEISGDQFVVKVDYSKLMFPLLLRKWQEGDTFQPLGMKGKKKLSDFMIDEKIPLNLKSDILVLTSEANVVWVLGRRIDERYKLTSTSKKALQLTISHD